MTQGGPTQQGAGRSRRSKGLVFIAAVVVSTANVAGCISVNAPAKPIVIELNINIKQEVVYRLSADAAKTIDENKDIF